MTEQIISTWMLVAPSGLYVSMPGHKCAQTNRQKYAARFSTETLAKSYAKGDEMPKRFDRRVKI